MTASWARDFELKSVAHHFPFQEFESEIEFWKEVFARYSRRQVIFHDSRDLRIIYKVVSFERDPHKNAREAARQRRQLKRYRLKLVRQLRTMATARSEKDLTQDSRRLAKLLRSLGYKPSRRFYARLQRDIRMQRGVREKFEAGIVRSGQFLEHIEPMFREFGLPMELTMLPHVESSFNSKARSKAGAVGLWQFIRGTGRIYLTINRTQDQRLDPLYASRAAAKLLRYNYEKLGNWPLAITAYNQGLNAMLRARKRWGPELHRIVSNHRSRTFGFSGRNFYPEFLAAVLVARNSHRYFPNLQTDPPWRFSTVELHKSYRVKDLLATANAGLAWVKTHNPFLRTGVWRYGVLPPRIELRLPAQAANQLVAGLPLLKAVVPRKVAPGPGTYRVRRGDTLSEIASRFGTSARRIQLVNQLPRPDLIYAGQILEIASARQAEQLITHRIQPGETLSSIASRYKTSVKRLREHNSISNTDHIVVGRELKVPSNGSLPTRYRVRIGDTLQWIARRFNTSIAKIQRLNRLRNANRIFPGQILLIPGGE